MKKSKYLALVLAVAIMLMGAGYAAWTDQVVISNNVETGFLEVEFIDPNYQETELSTASQYVNLSPVERTAKKVTFTLTNLYPGASYSTLTEIQNKGSIPVKFDNAVVGFAAGSNEDLKNNITVSYDCWIFNSNGDHIATIPGAVVSLTNLQSSLNSKLATLQLLPGQYVSLAGTPDPAGQSIDQLMTYIVNDGLETAEKANLTFDITFNWKQFNQ